MKHPAPHPIKKYGLLIILVVILIAFYFSGLHQYLSLTAIQENQEALLAWSNQHLIFTVSIYILSFTILIACTIPCATILTIAGGLLFGSIAILYAEMSILFGGFILYHAVRSALGSRITQSRKEGWLSRVEGGFKKNAFNYLLMLRLMPIFPCWVSNIGAGVTNVPQRTFLAASAIGILPSTIIYALVGRGLNEVLTQRQPLTADNVLKPALMLPLIGLAILSLLPIIYKQVKKPRKKH